MASVDAPPIAPSFWNVSTNWIASWFVLPKSRPAADMLWKAETVPSSDAPEAIAFDVRLPKTALKSPVAFVAVLTLVSKRLNSSASFTALNAAPIVTYAAAKLTAAAPIFLKPLDATFELVSVCFSKSLSLFFELSTLLFRSAVSALIFTLISPTCIYLDSLMLLTSSDTSKYSSYDKLP